jgi:quinol monooxygenase YgiN
MSMSEGVTVTVTWEIKPELTDAFVETLRGMFPETRLHKGFRNIRLLGSYADPNQFVLIEEWDEAQNFHDYAQFRVETGGTAELLAMTASQPQMGIWALHPLAAAKAERNVVLKRLQDGKSASELKARTFPLGLETF